MVGILNRRTSSGYLYGVPPPVVKRADAVRNRARILTTAEGAHTRDFVDALRGSEWLETAAADATRQRFRRALAKLLAKAQATGAIRTDIAATDLLALVRGVLASGGDAKVRGKLLAVLIDGLRVT